MAKIHLQKAFFGKNNCLKITVNNNLECYFEFGTPKKTLLAKKDGRGWNWKPVKFNDNELGEIINVLEGKKDSVSFFHDFKGDKTQIWIKKTEKFFSIKVKELSKGLHDGEQRVLLELLKHIVVRMNIKI
ncbi:MAG: hypothetical protein ACOCQQ_00465 [Candidatus Nanoarchaeia archaeon]